MSEEELWLYLETEIGKNQLLAKINKAVETLEEQERHIKEANAEIERLKEDNKYLNKVNIELSTEKNRLNNIINEYDKYALAIAKIRDLHYSLLNDKNFRISINEILEELKGVDKE